MSIFREMYELRVIQSPFNYGEIVRMVSEAMERGWVEEIPACAKGQIKIDERWFREKGTGEVYRLQPPGERSCGYWSEVEPQELFAGIVPGPSGQMIQ